MFETAYTMKVTKNFMHEFEHETKGKEVDKDKLYDGDYYKYWEGMKRMFDPKDKDAGVKILKGKK